MTYILGDSYVGMFVTRDPDTLALTDADALPTVVIYVNGVADAWGEAVANISTGLYKVTGTIATDLSSGDVASVVMSATVAGVVSGAIIDQFVIDTSRNSGLSDQIANIGFGTSADSVVATSDSSTPTGVETLTWEATAAPDGIFHEVAPDGGAIDQRYRFNVGGGAVGVSILWTGNVTSNNDSVEVFANTGTVAAATWQRVGTIDGKATSGIEIHTFNLVEGHTMTGVNLGEVEIRFESGVVGNVATNLRTDQILCQRQITSQTVGYADGAIWVDTNNGTAGTIAYTHGTADKPVLTWADALTLSASVGIARFHLVAGSSIQLTANSDGYDISGWGSEVDLNGQSVSGALFFGVSLIGNDSGTNAIRTHYHHCDIDDNTLGLYHMENCLLSGDVTLAEAGTYLMDFCSSGVAGTGTPSVNFGGSVGQTWFNMRHYSGGITIMNFSDSGADVMSLEGWGQLIIGGSCSAAGTIAIRGSFTITDNVSGGFVAGGGTLSEDARYDLGQINTALTEYDGPTKAEMDAGIAEIIGDLANIYANLWLGQTSITASNSATSFTIGIGPEMEDAWEGMWVEVTAAGVSAAETFESIALEDPFTGTADLTWVGDNSDFEIDVGDWPTGPAFGANGEKSLRSKLSGGAVDNTIVTDVSHIKTTTEDMTWEVFVSGDNAAIQVSISINLILLANDNDPNVIESPDLAFGGYKLEITDVGGSTDSIRLMRSTDTDVGWVTVHSEAFGAPKNVNEGWSLKVTRSGTGLWTIAYANGAKGTTPVTFFTVTDTNVSLVGNDWCTGVGWRAPASKSDFCGFDDFTVTGANNSQIRPITGWTAGRVVTVERAFSFTPQVDDPVKILWGVFRDWTENFDAIQVKTDQLSPGRIMVQSPVLQNGTIEIVAGDDYSVSAGTPLEIRITDYVGMSLVDATAELRITTEDKYNEGTSTSELTVTDPSPEMQGADAVFTFEMTAAQTVALATSPPDDQLNHTHQLAVIAAGGEVHTALVGALTVKERVE